MLTNQSSSPSRIPNMLAGSSNNFLNFQNHTYLRYASTAATQEYGINQLKDLLMDSSPYRPFSKIVAPYVTTQVLSTDVPGNSTTISGFTEYNNGVTKNAALSACASGSGQCATFTASSSGSPLLAISPKFPAVLGYVYRVTLQVKSGTASMPLLRFAMLRNGPTYESVNDLDISSFTYQPLYGTWGTVEFYVRAKTSLSNARIDIQVPLNTQIVLGQFEVSHVSAINTDYRSRLQMATNLSFTDTLSVPCPAGYTCDQWKDIWGTVLAFPYSLLPRSSKIMWRTP